MKRLTVEKPVKEMNMMELAHNCMFAKNRWAWYRDYEGEKDLMELIREINVVIGGSELPENNTLLEEVLQDNLQYSLSDKDGLIAFIYQSLWTKANLRERLKEYEDTDLTPEQIREIDKLYAEKCRELAEYQKAEENGLLLRLHESWQDNVADWIEENREAFEMAFTSENYSVLEDVIWSLKEKLAEMEGGHE